MIVEAMGIEEVMVSTISQWGDFYEYETWRTGF